MTQKTKMNGGRVAPSLAMPTLEVTSYLELHRRELLGMLELHEAGGVALARRHAKVMDGLLGALFQGASAVIAQDMSFPVVLGAVGGYGRGLVGWKSDLDVRVVTDAAPERAQRLAEALLYPLWNAGMNIGHQVSTISDLVEAARYDLPTATAVLDFRVVAGNGRLGTDLMDRAFAGIFSPAALPAFLERLDSELNARHKRFGDSIYLLEPDVKSGAGGLRDLDTALWAARARFHTSSIDGLRNLGVLSGPEARELKAARDFLWTLRHHLHRHANRRSDRLTFEEQEAISQLMKIRTPVEPIPPEECSLETSVESFMSRYYRNARVVLRLREQICARAMPILHRRAPRIVDLSGGIQLFNGQITVTRVSDLETEPALAFRMYGEALERSAPLLPFARDLVTRATANPAFCEALRRSPEAAERFVSLVSDPRKAPFRNGSILADLHDVGLLTAMIPEFLPVVGRVHHDVYHVYTVDVHSVAAVDFLRALARGDLAQEHPLASSLAANVSRPRVVYLATLLHDVGKAIGARDHSERGAELAAEILVRLGLSSSDVDDACHLIRKHLVMYHVAARRDLEDAATVSSFAGVVRGREGLRHLYVLTVADLSTTSPTSMTKWKRHMLDELFRSTDDALTRACSEVVEGSATHEVPSLSDIRRAVRARWDDDAPVAFLDEYLDSMPEAYRLSNTPEEIAWHARVALRARDTVVTADLVPSSRHDVAALCVATGNRPKDPLCVIAKDRPGLLAAIAAAITSNGFDVHAAQIHSRRIADGRVQAIDLFWVTARTRIENLSDALEGLRADLEKVITGAVAPSDLMKARRTRFSDRPVPAVATEVIVDNGTSATHTVVEVVTKDRPGLLFTMARTFHELDLNIGVAKINTEGNRVLDVFYVTDLDGRKLHGTAVRDAVRHALLTAMGATAASRTASA